MPGSHLNHHPLHDILPNAHEPEVQSLENLDSPIFSGENVDGAINVPMKAGDLIIGDARLLHSAGQNHTGERRTLSLAWYDCFSAWRAPSWWGDRPIPETVLTAWAEEGSLPREERPRYKLTRAVNLPWKPRGTDYEADWAAEYSREDVEGDEGRSAKL